jgi:hypothetical protein
VQCVICTEKGTQSSSSVVCLRPAFEGEFYAVVGDGLVDVTVFLFVLATASTWTVCNVK